MATAIVYYSKHHGNTKKLLDALPGGVVLIDAENPSTTDLSAFDRVGFASGIYAGSFARQVMRFAQEHLPERKPVFFVATAAMKLKSHFTGITHACEQRRAVLLGSYICQGFNTYGPFKLVGGTSKGHPTQKEINEFLAFYNALR
ncbi:MAG: flavodoxin [Clostridia bacterium]|nr:flavodoxin [Clostridia bacterium]